MNIASLEWSNTGENIIQSLKVAVTEWKANLVRIPLSQDRWFGKAPGQNDNGWPYQTIVDYLVKYCNDTKTYILLELHWNNARKGGYYTTQSGDMPVLIETDQAR